LKNWIIDWRIAVGAAAVVVVAGAVVVQRALRKPVDPEDEERRRRFQLNQVGRIVEGLVVELVETPASAPLESAATSTFPPRKAAPPGLRANGLRRLIRYSYSIAGSHTKPPKMSRASKSAFAWSVLLRASPPA